MLYWASGNLQTAYCVTALAVPETEDLSALCSHRSLASQSACTTTDTTTHYPEPHLQSISVAFYTVYVDCIEPDGMGDLLQHRLRATSGAIPWPGSVSS